MKIFFLVVLLLLQTKMVNALSAGKATAEEHYGGSSEARLTSGLTAKQFYSGEECDPLIRREISINAQDQQLITDFKRLLTNPDFTTFTHFNFNPKIIPHLDEIISVVSIFSHKERANEQVLNILINYLKQQLIIWDKQKYWDHTVINNRLESHGPDNKETASLKINDKTVQEQAISSEAMTGEK